MHRRLLVAALVTLITLSAAAVIVKALVLDLNTGFAFTVARHGPEFLIKPAAGVPLPPGLQAGDVLQLRELTPAARAGLFSQVNIRPGTQYSIVVQRGGKDLEVPVAARALPSMPGDRFANASSTVLFFALMILGLLAIWRGRNLAAWGLGLFAVAIIVHAAVQTVLLPGGMWPFWVGALNNFVVMPLVLVGLYLMAYDLSREGLPAKVRQAFSGVFGLFYLLLFAWNSIALVRLIYYGYMTPLVSVIGLVLFAVVSLTAFLLLITGYARAGAEQRLRIRWILYSTGVLMVSLVLDIGIALTTNLVTQITIENISNVILFLAVVGYTYAVLRQRLVAVRIVLNRTLVYGVITVIVVGVFAAINVLVDHATFGYGASLLLELVVPLALGIALDGLRKYLDRYLNRLVFRRQYRAEKALRDFARTCGFIEDAERLLDGAAQQVFQHSNAQGVALYERNAEGYQRLRQCGTAGFPQYVEADDAVFVRLRAGDREADLHRIASALGKDGYVFSMAVRGKLIGALVCGPRPAEHYSAEERALLIQVAQQVGAALHALRSRENEKFINAIAYGALDEAGARARARELITTWQAA